MDYGRRGEIGCPVLAGLEVMPSFLGLDRFCMIILDSL